MKDIAVGLLLSTATVLAPIKMVLLVTGILIFADLVTGIIAARKRKEEITSAGLRRTTTKSFIYLTSIIIGFLVETYMLEGFIPISKIIASLIGMTEMKSLLENLDDIKGTSLFKSLIDKLGSQNDERK